MRSKERSDTGYRDVEAFEEKESGGRIQDSGDRSQETGRGESMALSVGSVARDLQGDRDGRGDAGARFGVPLISWRQ